VSWKAILRQLKIQSREDSMKRILVLLLIAVFAAIGLAAQDQPAGGEKEKKVSAAKLERWSGSILRMDKDGMTLTVRKKGGMEKIIHYSSATAWTKKAGGAADSSTLKEGDRVVCFGKTEGDKFVATEIIVQTPK
jgi:hypothetical protein